MGMVTYGQTSKCKVSHENGSTLLSVSVVLTFALNFLYFVAQYHVVRPC